jgi:predicted dehydrogenase
MSAPEPANLSEPSASDYALISKAAPETAAPDLPYRPPMPRDRSVAIALIGAGGISSAHLDAYARYGLNVVAICSRDLSRARARRDEFFPQALVTDSFESLLNDPVLKVLDITTHPDIRADLMRRALSADKHVLSQKPFVEDLAVGRELVELAAQRGVRLAVNQNGRWAPHLAYIREAVRAGLLGEVTGVHVEIRWNHGWIAGTAFDEIEDLILWDFGIHWFDFLVSVIGERARSVQATTARAAEQTARPPLLAQALIAFDSGQASLVFDGATRFGAHDATTVIGAEGVAFSQGPDLGNQSVVLHTEAGVARPALSGAWFNDGFAGAMGELLSAIEENREPLNSASGNLHSIRLCQAAIQSARVGHPVAL